MDERIMKSVSHVIIRRAPRMYRKEGSMMFIFGSCPIMQTSH